MVNVLGEVLQDSVLIYTKQMTPNFDFVQRFTLEHTYQVPKLLVRIHFDVARPKG